MFLIFRKKKGSISEVLLGYARTIRGSVARGSLGSGRGTFRLLGNKHIAKETQDIEEDMKRKIRIADFLGRLYKILSRLTIGQFSKKQCCMSPQVCDVLLLT